MCDGDLTVRFAGAILLASLVLSAALSPGAGHAKEDDALGIRSAQDARPLLERAEALLEADEAERAYTLLSAEELRFAGDAWFDYLLGVAALDSGRPGQAVFSLRRALVVEPGFSGARLELARAHYEAGNASLARPLFESLLGEAPPPRVRTAIEAYIGTIDAPHSAPDSGFTPFVEVASGYDTNANGSTDDNRFLGFTLAAQNVETDSPFGRVAAGFNANLPQSERLSWYLGGQAYHRSNPDASFVDSTVISGQGGFLFRSGRMFGRFGVNAYQAWRDGIDNQNWLGADVVVGRRLGDDWELSLGLRGGPLRHDDTIQVLDVDRTLYSIGLGYRMARETVLTLSAVGGSDSANQAGSPYGNDRAGVSLSLVAPAGSGYLRLAAGTLTSDYDGLFFGVARDDTQTSVAAEIEFRDVGVTGLSIVPQARFVNNDSDVDLYAYDRAEIGITIRWTPR